MHLFQPTSLKIKFNQKKYSVIASVMNFGMELLLLLVIVLVIVLLIVLDIVLFIVLVIYSKIKL